MKKAPIIKKNDGMTSYYCPKCRNRILSTKDMRQTGKKDNYCRICGCKINWENITLEVYWAN